MAKHIEVETRELQETIQELHEEREERAEQEKKLGWTRYVGLSTAILAVFAAIGALRSSYLVNEALINQVKASDTWTQYQAARQKDHLYSLMLNALLDANASNPDVMRRMGEPEPKSKKSAEELRPGTPKPKPTFKPKTVANRAVDYRTKVYDEMAKEELRSKEAQKLQDESVEQLHKHHRFEYSVALFQVAIALGAIAALTRVKPVWYVSMVTGAAGIALFFFGFMP